MDKMRRSEKSASCTTYKEGEVLPQYNVGDEVIVRRDLKSGERYRMLDSHESNSATTDMAALAGEVVTISDSMFQYRVKQLRGVRWTDGMFEGLAFPEQPDFEPSDMEIEELLFGIRR